MVTYNKYGCTSEVRLSRVHRAAAELSKLLFAGRECSDECSSGACRTPAVDGTYSEHTGFLCVGESLFPKQVNAVVSLLHCESTTLIGDSWV